MARRLEPLRRRRTALPCALQRLEADVRLVPRVPRRLVQRRADALARLSSWDEWVPEERLKKFNEENIKQQKQLVEAQRARDAAERLALAKQEAEEAKKKGAAASVPGGAAPVVAGRREEKRGQKRGRDGEGVRRFAWHGRCACG